MSGNPGPVLDGFVEHCIQDKVVLVCFVGDCCEYVEDLIDELAVADGSDPTRFLNTTSHPNQSIEEVRAFAEAWTIDVDPELPVQEMQFQASPRRGVLF